MRPKHSGQPKASAERVVKDIRRATRRHFSAEDKIRIVLEGLRGEDSIAELCRKEGIAQSLYYTWSKEFMEAGKHVQVEIPLADSWADAQVVLDKQQQTGLVCMVGHTRRFNPSHQYVHGKIVAGEFNVQHMDVQTYFFRRKNMNAKGEARSWTDHLLWHHAAHTVDLFAYQAGKIVQSNAIEGPHHKELGIAMDMSIQLKSESGAICTLSLSFNNDGPIGTFFRYIGDSATYLARYDDLFTGKEEQIDVSNVDVSLNGIELQDREFIAAIRESREPNSSVQQVLPCYKVLHELEQQFR